MRRCLPLTLLFALGGCIKAPEIVLVDRATALEEQAGGSFKELQEKLERNATTPRPTPLTPEQLEELGLRPAPLADETSLSDMDRVDLLLKQHCVGESKDGTLVGTPDDCLGAADRDLAATLVERVNLARTQLWRWMHDRHPAATPEEMKRSWHEAHLKGVVCDGWVQKSDGGWEAKKC